MSDRSSAVLSYLETLYHDELIELLHSFATTHEDIRLTIEGKSGVNNTKTRNDTAVEHSRQISQTVPESVTADVYVYHPSHVLVTRNSTAQEKIN